MDCLAGYKHKTCSILLVWQKHSFSTSSLQLDVARVKPALTELARFSYCELRDSSRTV